MDFLFQLSTLCKKLDELWNENEGEVILFIWTSFLKDETLDFLNVTSPLDLSNVVHKRKHQRCKGRTSESVDNDNKSRTSRSDHETQALNSPIDTSSDSQTPGDPLCPNINDLESDTDTLTLDVRAKQDVASQDLLWPILRDHDDAQRLAAFQATLITCQVSIHSIMQIIEILSILDLKIVEYLCHSL